MPGAELFVWITIKSRAEARVTGQKIRVSITNMLHLFFRNKTFLSAKIESWNFVRFHEILNHQNAENVSIISWEENKFCYLKRFDSLVNTNWC